MGEAKRKMDAGLVSPQVLEVKRLQKGARERMKPPAGYPENHRVDPYHGNLFVLDSPTEWLLIDTLDPNLLPERQNLVKAVREGFWIQAMPLTKLGVENMKRDLPPGTGAGRYYLITQRPGQPDLQLWFEVTHVVNLLAS